MSFVVDNKIILTHFIYKQNKTIKIIQIKKDIKMFTAPVQYHSCPLVR